LGRGPKGNTRASGADERRPVRVPVLDPSEVAIFEAVGTRRRAAAGDYLYHEGDPHYDFWIVLSGAVDVVVDDADDQ